MIRVPSRLAVAFVAVLLCSACGGGGGSVASPPAASEPAVTFTASVEPTATSAATSRPTPIGTVDPIDAITFTVDPVDPLVLVHANEQLDSMLFRTEPALTPENALDPSLGISHNVGEPMPADVDGFMDEYFEFRRLDDDVVVEDLAPVSMAGLEGAAVIATGVDMMSDEPTVQYIVLLDHESGYFFGYGRCRAAERAACLEMFSATLDTIRPKD
jgi:hypothetical protein